MVEFGGMLMIMESAAPVLAVVPTGLFAVAVLAAAGLGAALALQMKKLRAAAAESAALQQRLAAEEIKSRQALESAGAQIAAQMTAKNKELEQMRREADAAVRARTDFFAGISHDLRTPLTSIIGFSEMLLAEARDGGPEHVVSDLERINGAGNHLLALINNILDLLKMESGRMTVTAEAVDFPKLVAEVVKSVEPVLKKNGTNFQASFPGAMDVIQADRGRVRQVLLTLLRNAARHTEKGEVTLKVTLDKTSSSLLCTVADSGCGMTPGQFSRLFEMQARTSEAHKTTEGTGLSLVVGRKVCQLMGGDLWAHSEAGKGSSFSFRLPLQSSVEAGARPSASRNSMRVLVVDAVSKTRSLLQRFLSAEGFEVEAAADGPDALDRAREFKPQVILLDIAMPASNGWPVLTQLQSDPKITEIPIRFVSHSEIGGEVDGALVENLSKPVDWTRLSTLVTPFQTGSGQALVIDDNTANREMFQRNLKLDGWNVTAAVNGSDGLAKLEAGRPDVILLDLIMPEMDGFQFMHALRQREGFRDVPVIVITGKDLRDYDRKALRGGIASTMRTGGFQIAEVLRDLREAASPTGG